MCCPCPLQRELSKQEDLELTIHRSLPRGLGAITVTDGGWWKEDPGDEERGSDEPGLLAGRPGHRHTGSQGGLPYCLPPSSRLASSCPTGSPLRPLLLGHSAVPSERVPTGPSWASAWPGAPRSRSHGHSRMPIAPGRRVPPFMADRPTHNSHLPTTSHPISLQASSQPAMVPVKTALH